ncbi:MAG: hypothetical protein ACFCUJ_01070 [Thiotrichales bacterium]
MSGTPKTVLVVARNKTTEALRMASGLTLLDAQVRVLVSGPLDDEDPEVQTQLDSLEFADVPITRLVDPATEAEQLVEAVLEADAVYML